MKLISTGSSFCLEGGGGRGSCIMFIVDSVHLHRRSCCSEQITLLLSFFRLDARNILHRRSLGENDKMKREVTACHRVPRQKTKNISGLDGKPQTHWRLASKVSPCPIDPHVSVSNFTAEIHMFTAWYKDTVLVSVSDVQQL